ncbi:MAG: DUF4870 domain-containing protein [Alphaproteobacteria bacterium]
MAKKITKSSNGNFLAMMCHLSSLLGLFLLPVLGNLIFPLIIWGFGKRDFPLVRDNGRSIINFVLSMWFYFFCLMSSLILFLAITSFSTLMITNTSAWVQTLPNLSFNFGFGWSWLMILWSFSFLCFGLFMIFCQFVLVLFGSMKALNGEVYEYPLTIKFLKN